MPILNVTDVYPSLARLYVYRARRIPSEPCLREPIDEVDLPRKYLCLCGFGIEPLRAVDFWKRLAAPAPGRPLDFEGVAGEHRRIEVALSTERDNALPAPLPDLAQRLLRQFFAVTRCDYDEISRLRQDFIAFDEKEELLSYQALDPEDAAALSTIEF
jgi:hypothetical protein